MYVSIIIVFIFLRQKHEQIKQACIKYHQVYFFTEFNKKFNRMQLNAWNIALCTMQCNNYAQLKPTVQFCYHKSSLTHTNWKIWNDLLQNHFPQLNANSQFHLDGPNAFLNLVQSFHGCGA